MKRRNVFPAAGRPSAGAPSSSCISSTARMSGERRLWATIRASRRNLLAGSVALRFSTFIEATASRRPAGAVRSRRRCRSTRRGADVTSYL